MSNTNEEFKVWLRCSDGVSIDGKPFDKESVVVRDCYEYEDDAINVKSQSEILYKVREFCEKRANILQNDPANDEILLFQKLNDFNVEFLKQNKTYAIDLMIAACNLEIKSLLDLMMKDVVGMLTQMTSDEIYDIFIVNLQEYNYNDFEVMVQLLDDSGWAFE